MTGSKYPGLRRIQHATPAVAVNTDHVEDLDSDCSMEGESASKDIGKSPGRSSADARKRISEAVDGVYQANEAAKPKKTKDHYAGPLKEWDAWCNTQELAEADQNERFFVTPFKAAAFLQECVVDRPVRARGKPKTATSAAAAVPQPEPRTIGHKSLMRYVEALVRLWEKQGQSEGNKAAHPRLGPVSTIIDTVKRTKAIHDRRHFDKLANPIQSTLLDLAPELMSNMNARFDHLEQRQKQMMSAMESATTASQLHSQLMVDIITGRLTPRISWCWTADPGPASSSLPVGSLPFVAESLEELRQARTSVSGSTASAASNSSNLPPMSIPSPAAAVLQPSPAKGKASTLPISNPAAQLPEPMQGSRIAPEKGTQSAGEKSAYHMSKTLTTVSDAWREYAQGIGGPALKTVYEADDWSWAGRDSERKYWRRREPLLQAVERFAAAHGQPAVVVADHMDAYRLEKRISLNQFAELCKTGTYKYEAVQR